MRKFIVTWEFWTDTEILIGDRQREFDRVGETEAFLAVLRSNPFADKVTAWKRLPDGRAKKLDL